MRNVSLSAAFSIDEYQSIIDIAEKLGVSKSTLIRAATMFVALLEPSLIGALSILSHPELAVQSLKDTINLVRP